MSDEIPGSAEPVPNALRILASGENLGELRSVHRPATFLARRTLKQARIYLFGNGLVLSNGRGGLGVFRWDQVTATRRGPALAVRRADGVTLRLTRHWTDSEALTSAVEQGEAGSGGV